MVSHQTSAHNTFGPDDEPLNDEFVDDLEAAYFDAVMADAPEPVDDKPDDYAPARAGLTAMDEIISRFNARGFAATPNEIIERVTKAYVEKLDPLDPPMPLMVESNLVSGVREVLRAQNRMVPQGERIRAPQTLDPWQIAQIMLRLHRIVRISPKGVDLDRRYDVLAIYMTEGSAEGLYSHSDYDLREVAKRYKANLSDGEFREIVFNLQTYASRVHPCEHPDLVALANGIFNYRREEVRLTVSSASGEGTEEVVFPPKKLHPFHPGLVYQSKAAVRWNAEATSPVISDSEHGEWEIEAWMLDLFDDDEEMAELAWEILGAILRPHVRWNKTAWFYSEVGNNGKGTLCALMRNVLGPRAHTSIPLSDFGNEFALEPLVNAKAIIVDENDVGTFIDKAANLKAVVTGDVIQINRKFRDPLAVAWCGFMVQCLNELPKFNDRSESFYRRQLFVPFTKSFTGRERREIKGDYLQRTEVLEYVVHRVLMMDYDELSAPAPTQELMSEYKVYNDPTREFWQEFRDQFVWDLLPFTFLYDLFAAWYRETHPAGRVLPYKRFVSDLRGLIQSSDVEWYAGRLGAHGSDRHRTGSLMNAGEPLIAEYDLTKWKDPGYSGFTPARIGMPPLRESYRGPRRVSSMGAAGDPDRPDDDAPEAP